MKNEKLITWLEAFIELWDVTTDVDGFDDMNTEKSGSISELLVETIDEFCIKNDLPLMSADDLIVHIKSL